MKNLFHVRRTLPRAASLAWLLIFSLSRGSALASAPAVIEPRLHHLRNGPEAEWAEFADLKPDGAGLEVKFQAVENAQEQYLLLRQKDVKLDWALRLNGKKIGSLFLMEADLEHAVRIPPRGLLTGENLLQIAAPRENDDIWAGEIRLADSLPDATTGALLSVEIVSGGAAIPARITVTRSNGSLAQIHTPPAKHLAVRPGVVYTGTGQAELSLWPGEYQVWASRGPEYSVGAQQVRLDKGARTKLHFSLVREAPAEKWVACDTHVHTVTFSGHGDATSDERLVTLAGEGIELPIATDHNVHIDYRDQEAAKDANASFKPFRWFTPVVGNEVTTRQGHFNIFPVAPRSRPPNFRIEHWPDLMAEVKSATGARVVILNHPRDLHSNFRPFAETNFVAATGENRRGFEFQFNGVELINSGALRTSWREVFTDWLGLLNSGLKVTAVGASDSHDVSRYIVGQGRTYLRSTSQDVSNIDVDEAVQNFLAGRAVVSLGLLIDVSVEDTFEPGDLVKLAPRKLNVKARVLGPSWVEAREVELYANGQKLGSKEVPANSRLAPGVKGTLTWELKTPAHDLFLVAVASGPGVLAPYWAIPRPYQPSSKSWTPFVLSVANPIWIDADGDGRFSSARDYAQELWRQHKDDPKKFVKALAGYDEAAAFQAMRLWREAGVLNSAEWAKAAAGASPEIQNAYRAYRSAFAPNP